MSQGGMFIVAPEHTSVGQRLQVVLQPKSQQERIKLELEVLWAGSQGEGGPVRCGTRIVNFSAGKDAYETFVQQGLQRSAQQAAPQSIPAAGAEKKSPSQRPGSDEQSHATETIVQGPNKEPGDPPPDGPQGP